MNTKAPLRLALLLCFFGERTLADDVSEVRNAATVASKALSDRNWNAVFQGWSKSLQFVHTWEAFFEATVDA